MEVIANLKMKIPTHPKLLSAQIHLMLVVMEMVDALDLERRVIHLGHSKFQLIDIGELRHKDLCKISKLVENAKECLLQ